jgi:tetratricopeptide (TPR) repeat protein
MREADLTRSNLVGARLCEADLGKANLTEANCQMADLSSADLTLASLAGADLRFCSLEGAWLMGADLRGALLEGANLRGARLWNASLIGADLHDADLTKAECALADFSDANASGTILDDANVRGTLFVGTNLSKARSLGTTLFVRLEGSTGDEPLRPPLYSSTTDFSGTGFVPGSSGWQRVEERSRKEGDLYRDRGYELLPGAIDKAFVEFSKAIAICPDDVDAFSGRADALVMLNKPRAALFDLRTAIALCKNRSDRVQLWYSAALVHEFSGDLSAAVDAVSMAIKLDPSSAQAYLWRGKFLLKLGRQEDAAMDLRRCTELGGVLPPSLLEFMRSSRK